MDIVLETSILFLTALILKIRKQCTPIVVQQWGWHGWEIWQFQTKELKTKTKVVDKETCNQEYANQG